MKPPKNARAVEGLLKPGTPVVTHSIQGTVKRIAVSGEGDRVQYLVAYSDPATEEAHERFFEADEIFLPQAEEGGAQ